MGFGVSGAMGLLDLQAAIFVGNNVCDDDGFTGHIGPKCGFCGGGDL